MMDVITGKTRPDTGEVVFAGQADLTKLDEASIATLGIGRKFQKPDRVREPHGARQPPAGAGGLRGCYKLLLATPAPGEPRSTRS
jgi:urea transport system ATP-binding protein